MAKGYALHPQRRSWKRFEPWQAVETGRAQVAAAVGSIEVCDAPAPTTVVPETPAEKVCWEATVKVVPHEPPVQKVCWEGPVEVISGLEKTCKDPPKKL
jgi:hypothetical protein